MCQSPVSSSQNVTGVMRDSLGLLGSVRNAAAQARERALALADDAAAKETVELGSLHLSQALMKLDQLLARHQGQLQQATQEMLSGLMWELQLSLEHAAEHAVGSVFMKATDFVNQTRTALCDMIHFSGCSAPLGSSPSQGAYELQASSDTFRPEAGCCVSVAVSPDGGAYMNVPNTHVQLGKISFQVPAEALPSTCDPQRISVRITVTEPRPDWLGGQGKHVVWSYAGPGLALPSSPMHA